MNDDHSPCPCCDDAPIAVIKQGDDTWHDGAGWYYVDDEYPDEGSCGAFATRDEAVDHARESGYAVAPEKLTTGAKPASDGSLRRFT